MKIFKIILFFYFFTFIYANIVCDDKYLFSQMNRLKFLNKPTLTGSNSDIKVLRLIKLIKSCNDTINDLKHESLSQINNFKYNNKNIINKNKLNIFNEFDSEINKYKNNKNNPNILKDIINLYKKFESKIENQIGKGVDLYSNEIKQEYIDGLNVLKNNMSKILKKYDKKLNRSFLNNIKFKFKNYFGKIEQNIGKGIDLSLNYINIQLKQENIFFDNNIKFFNKEYNSINKMVKKNNNFIDKIFEIYTNFANNIEKNIGFGIDLRNNFIENQLNEEYSFFSS